MIDLNKLYKRAFGITATMIANEELNNIQGLKNPHFPFLVKSEKEGLPINTSSKPVFLDRKTYLSDLQIGDLKLPIPPSISIEIRKNIVYTPIAGRDFTVKEVINTDDYRFVIKGFVITKPNVTVKIGNNDTLLTNDTIDTDFLKKLNDLMRKNTAHKIICPLFYYLGVQYAVIESIRIPEMTDYTNAFAYEINLVSDVIPEIDQKFGLI